MVLECRLMTELSSAVASSTTNLLGFFLERTLSSSMFAIFVCESGGSFLRGCTNMSCVKKTGHAEFFLYVPPLISTK